MQSDVGGETGECGLVSELSVDTEPEMAFVAIEAHVDYRVLAIAFLWEIRTLPRAVLRKEGTRSGPDVKAARGPVGPVGSGCGGSHADHHVAPAVKPHRPLVHAGRPPGAR